MKSRRKTRIKGITGTLKYSNGLELQFRDLYSYMGILVDMSGDTLRRFRAKGWTDRQVVNACWIGTLTTCLMTVRHKRLTPAPLTHDAADLAIDCQATRIWKWNQQIRWHGRKKSKCGIKQYNRRTHGYDEQRSRAEAMRTWITAVLKPQTLDDPSGRKQIRCTTVGTTDEQRANPILVGWNHGVVRAGIGVKIYPSRSAKCATGGRWYCFLSSYLSVYG